MNFTLRTRAAAGTLVALFVLVSPASAQKRSVFKDSDGVKNAFKDVIGQTYECVASIECEVESAKPKLVSLGTVVSADGYILTKASELKGKIVCKLKDRGEHLAQIVGLHPEYDLALLKIDADDLPVVSWSTEDASSLGQWVVAPGAEKPLGVGVVSVVERKVEDGRGVLGIVIEDGQGSPVIREVSRGSAAEAARLKRGDSIIQVDGKEMQSRMDLIRYIGSRGIGAQVKLTVVRGDSKMLVSAKLRPAGAGFQDRIGGSLSERSEGFPIALQHDTVLKPEQCGGPLLGLDGKVLGVNIARAGRVISYAIPAEAILKLLPDLKAGKFAPAAEAAAVDLPTEPVYFEPVVLEE
jgi:serine protease Do